MQYRATFYFEGEEDTATVLFHANDEAEAQIQCMKRSADFDIAERPVSHFKMETVDAKKLGA